MSLMSLRFKLITYPLFQHIDHIPKVLRQYVPLHHIRRCVHDFVLVRQLGVDPICPFPFSTHSPTLRPVMAHTLYNE